jgi:PAS domain-containing protein
MVDALDFRTVLIVFALIRVCQAMGLVYVWHTHRKYDPARAWAIGSVLIAVGAFLAASRGDSSTGAEIIASNLFVYAGALTFNAGVVKACAGRVPWRAGGALFCIAVLGLIWFTLLSPSLAARTLILMSVIVLCKCYAAAIAIQAPRGPLRRTQLVIAGLLLLEAGTSAVHGIVAVQIEQLSVLQSGPTQTLAMLSFTATAFLLAIALTNLACQRITGLFEATLSHLNQGVAMFDDEHKLIVSNDRYARVYGTDPESLRPGMTLSDIVAARAAKGIYADRTLADNREAAPGPITLGDEKLRHLNDGRTVAISGQPMDGGGWVTTHEDVTARCRAEAMLAESARQLTEANQRFNAAISNLPQGLALFDGNRRIVFCNDNFATMYGLSPEQLKPGTLLSEIYRLRAERSRIGSSASPNRTPGSTTSTTVARYAWCTSRCPMAAGSRSTRT